MELFAFNFNLLLLLLYVELSIWFPITWILKKVNYKIALFPSLTDLPLDYIYIYFSLILSIYLSIIG